LVEATDPNGTFPVLSASPLPAGANLEDRGDGSAIFRWTPAEGQAGQYEISYTASDGVLQAARWASIVVTSASDTDGDKLPDDWEREHFGNLAADGSGDADSDGLTDYQEFLNGTHPMASNAPDVPRIVSPADDSEVSTLTPQLVIENSTDPDDDPISYIFELSADEAMQSIVDRITNLPSGFSESAWTISAELADNTLYYWRVRATDGFGYSTWAYGSFFVNLTNDPPQVCLINRPQVGGQVDRLRPVLEVINSTDVDRDDLTYGFAAYSADDPATPLVSVSDLLPGADGTTDWTVSMTLADNAEYLWQAIVTDEHGESVATQMAAFTINTVNDAPGAPTIAAPEAGEEVAVTNLVLEVGNAHDLDGDVLSYFFELDTVNTFSSANLLTSAGVHEGNGITGWSVSDLAEDTTYYWRVKAGDGTAQSPWAIGQFFVNAANQAPGIPVLKNPGNMAWVPTDTPILEIYPSTDSDQDPITYWFELGLDADFTDSVVIEQTEAPEWTTGTALSDNTTYYWHVQAVDEHGAESGWSQPASFFVNSNGVDDSPQIALLQPSENLFTNTAEIELVWEDSDPDSNASIGLYVDTDGTGEDGNLIAGELQEDADGEDDRLLWDIGSLDEGTYYVYAVISDDLSSAASYAPGSIIVDRTAPLITMIPAGGAYSNPVIVTVSVDETGSLYCTKDGSMPTTESIPYGRPIELSDSATVACLAIDAAGNLSTVSSQSYTITVTANLAPVANAGDDFSIFLGDMADPDGSASADPDNGPGPTVFSWQFVSLPAGSGLTADDITDADTLHPHFVPDVTGTYELELAVADGQDSATDRIRVTCNEETGQDILGDLDGDADIDSDDLNIFVAAFFACNGDAAYNARCDYDGDGCITFVDYQIWHGFYYNQ
jgi:hypothetical protein